MLALRLHPDLRLRLHEEPAPDPGPEEALIRVTSVGLCGSDRHWVVDGGIGDAVLDVPLILGHEFAGVVETGRFAGRLVAVDPAVPCERCEPCRTGASNLCLATRFAGHGRTDGALRGLVAWPERCLHPVSDALGEVEAALVEPLAVAIHALDLAGSIEGASVGVVGCGPIGLLLVALARASGAETIVATDPLPHRVAAAAALEATTVIQATPDGDERAGVLAATGGRGVDISFDAAGEGAAVDSAIHVVRPGGQVILAGIASGDRTTFGASVARRKELTLRLSHRSTPDSFRRAVELMERHRFDLGGFVTLRVPLTEAARAFDALVDRSGIKVIIEPAAVSAGAGERWPA